MKYCGKERGSITLFLALILSLLLSLVCTSIESVRMASARTQILNSMDIGLYSVFGQYDRKLLEEYDLFALDGSMGGGQLNLAKICDNLESYMKPVLKQNSQKLELHQSGLTGYRLLTDECGEVFYQQIVQYMQETLGSQGVQLLLNKMSDRERKTEEADLKAKQAETGGSIDRYDSEMNQASQKSRQAAQEAENRQQQEGQISTQPAPTQPQADNPISIIKRIMKMGILELVLPPGREISTRTVSKDTMVSGRQLQQGMEMPDGVIADNSYTSQVLFQQYLMNHLGNYMDSSKEGLAYQMEYIFAGKDEDMDNLKSVASKLLFIREGVNFACLMADNVKRTEAQALASAIAAGFLVPPAAVVIETALLLCWAFAESILDLRELLDGGKVALFKTAESWQLSLEQLPKLLETGDQSRKNAPGGMEYSDYLRLLLMQKSGKAVTFGAMDLVEYNMRTEQQQPGFRLDCCVDELEAGFTAVIGKREYEITRNYGYEMQGAA